RRAIAETSGAQVRSWLPGADGIGHAPIAPREQPTSVVAEAAPARFPRALPNQLPRGCFEHSGTAAAIRGQGKRDPAAIGADAGRSVGAAGIDPARGRRLRIQDPSAGMPLHFIALVHRLRDDRSVAAGPRPLVAGMKGKARRRAYHPLAAVFYVARD